MKTFTYKDNNTRCRVKSAEYGSGIELQIQERYLFIFWKNAYKSLDVSEGFWGESERIPILKLGYMGGGEREVYMTGTLNLKNRVYQLFDEYFDCIERRNNMKNMINHQFELLNQEP